MVAFELSSTKRGRPPKLPSHRRFACALPAKRKEESRTEETITSPKRSICFITDSSDNIGNENLGQDVNLTEITAELACNLDVPVYPEFNRDMCPHTHALVVVPYRFESIVSYALAIQELGIDDSKQSRRRRSSTRPKSKPFHVDFLPPSNSRLGKRFEGQSGTDLLIKAVSPYSKVVHDLTAGLGQDSLLMAQGGASRVYMVERDPVVAALLSDALRRLQLVASDGNSQNLQTKRALDLSERLKLEEARDAVKVAQSIIDDPSTERPDVCYLDPMFPSRKKAAAVKKNMQILHGLLGSQMIHDLEATQNEKNLLEAALSLAKERVVVKRPINANCLSGSTEQEIKPSYEIKGSVNRWDVYVK